MLPLETSITSPYPDYAPIISQFGNTLFIASQRPLTNSSVQDPNINQHFGCIYESEKVGNHWSTVKSFQADGKKSHDKPVYVSPSEKLLVINKMYDKKTSDIYMTEQQSGKWSEPKSLGSKINTSGWESGGYMHANGKKIIFASDRAGGFGGLDLYEAELLEDGIWDNIKNMGDSINTIYDEEAAFVSADGKSLYFISEGHNSMGGYDIFKSEYINNHWTNILNIGYPINTPEDEIGISWTSNMETAYISSIRSNGLGSEDIFVINPTNKTIVDKKKEPEPVAKKIATAEEINSSENLDEKIYFPFNEYKSLSKKNIRSLDKVNEILKEKPDSRLLICGYADEIGNEDVNMEISIKRAELVRNELYRWELILKG